MKNIFVYGGCISRDVFNEPYNKGALNLIAYVARYSMAKLWATPTKISLDEKVLPSVFQRRAVENDAKNNLFYFLELREYDYLLVDFMFTRFKLVEYNSTFLTYSAELRRSGIITSAHKVIDIDTPLYWEYFQRGLDLFINNLVKNDKLNKLLVNKIYLATHDNQGHPFEDVNQHNDLLEKVYSLIEKSIGRAQILEYEPNLFVADVDHRWGRDPKHYIDGFYNTCYKKIESL